MERCFAEINRQLESKGLILKKGTLLYASLVAAAHNPPAKSRGMGAAHPTEPGADWVNKARKSYFGTKLHVGGRRPAHDARPTETGQTIGPTRLPCPHLAKANPVPISQRNPEGRGLG